ncbi:hypothetical protein BDW62DRAFT_196780 [Aspergillus aurantiobrunneus]
MAVGQDQGQVPLYVHTVQRVLREMRLLQQMTGSKFDYREFTRRILDSDLLPGQLEPLKQRLDTLESFLPFQQAVLDKSKKGKMADTGGTGSSWTPKRSQLTIVDLSCPCISPDTACFLFNVCFAIFMKQDTEVGRAVALDEAHKPSQSTAANDLQYMKDSVEARSFTETALRRQIATPPRCPRPDLHAGADYLQGPSRSMHGYYCASIYVASMVTRARGPCGGGCDEGDIASWAQRGVSGILRDVNEFMALSSNRSSSSWRGPVFSPSAVLGSSQGLHTLGDGYMVIQVRNRVTEDGGRSIVSS